MRRSDQRRGAVFALYQHDLTGRGLSDALGPNAPLFSRALAHAVVDHQPELDAEISRHVRNWTLERIAPLERAILRVALLEMLHPGLVPADEPISREGAIAEAVETAKRFCGPDAPGFVNGILGAAKRAADERAAA